MKKIIIKGKWNDSIEHEWEGDLITTLRRMQEKCLEDDNTGYFFDVENADLNWVKTTSLPLFYDKYGELVAPTDYTIVEETSIK